MFAPRLPSRHARSLILIALCAALVGALPAAPARAAVEFAVPVDDTTAEFGEAGSTFLLSSLVEQTGETPASHLGGVQLAPVGTLDFVNAANPLPEARTDIKAVAIGKYIFAIGGNTGTAPSNVVYRGVVDQATGQVAWGAAPPLPAVSHSATSGFTGQTAGRASVALAALVTDAAAGNGLIYVIGGTFLLGQIYSSRSVLVGTVQGGVLTGWRPVGDSDNNAANGVDGFIPAVYGPFNTAARGVDGASAFIAEAGGKTYLYVVGGRQLLTTSSTPAATNRIIYAEITNTATGDITWKSTSNNPATFFDIPLSDPMNHPGFYNAALVYGEFPGAGPGSPVERAFFLTGGRTDPTEAKFTSRVVKGIINSNGTITFDASARTDVGPPAGDGSLLDTRNGHGAALWDRSIYTFGGRPGSDSPANSPEATSSPITDQGILTNFQGAGGNFQRLVDNTPSDLPRRMDGGYVVVPSDRAGVAYVYYIGGTDGSAARPDVSRATVGEPPVTPTYPADGWYIAAPFPIALGGTAVKVKNVKWYGKDIDGGADLEVSYRLSTDTDCSLLRTREDVAWTVELDGTTDPATFSQNGLNEAALDTAPANCFQYRVKLIRGVDPETTPSMIRLSIVVEIPGSADLKFKEAGVTPLMNISGGLLGLRTTIMNENLFEPPTVSADYGDGGSFALDLFIYPPGVTPNPADYTPPLPNVFPSSQYNRATMQINRSLLTANKVYEVLSSDARWCYNSAPGVDEMICNGQGLPLATLFPTTGAYTVVAVVDGPNCGMLNVVGCVKETAVGFSNPNAAEENNVSQQVQVVLSAPPPPDGATEIYLPLSVRQAP
ncbi:MAG TPA: hypothetical protein VNL77_24135 [Roseiflexaceae bacterium]|nr:hypothetical protein [Roseiflexaceae bacterium]